MHGSHGPSASIEAVPLSVSKSAVVYLASFHVTADVRPCITIHTLTLLPLLLLLRQHLLSEPDAKLQRHAHASAAPCCNLHHAL
jgi:hypothetical protein